MRFHRSTVTQQSTVGLTKTVTYCSTNAGVWASPLDLQQPKMSTLGLFPLPCWAHSYPWLIIKAYTHIHIHKRLPTHTHNPQTSNLSSLSPNDGRFISRSGGTSVPEHSNLTYRIMARESVTMESGWLSKYSNPLPNSQKYTRVMKGKNSITAWQQSKKLDRKYVIRLSKCRNADAGDDKVVNVCVCVLVCLRRVEDRRADWR